MIGGVVSRGCEALTFREELKLQTFENVFNKAEDPKNLSEKTQSIRPT
jgi:hypothetical protein